MNNSNQKHLIKEQREVIEDGINNSDSARTIAKRIGVAASTVTREVKNNRYVRERKRRYNAKLSIRCAHYRDCNKSGFACKKCSTKYSTCKNCKTRSCIDSCPNFERKMCPETEKWPYVCKKDCSRKSNCSYPTCHYRAHDAHDSYKERLVDSRQGISLDQGQLKDMDNIITPLVKQGHSFEAIWSKHKDMPVTVRTAYNYQSKNILSVTNLDHPRIARCKPRKTCKVASTKDRVNREGRTYADFLKLPLEDQVRVVQGDSVEGFKHNKNDIFSLYVVRCLFQFYFLKEHASTQGVVDTLDLLEICLGTRIAFEMLFGIILLDRGPEFDDWQGMERSCLEKGEKRCQVFYCDPLASNQKAQAERNHEQLRRILPKGRSDFDKLTKPDVSVCCSHVNSYPNARRAGMCPFEIAKGTIPTQLFDLLSLGQIEDDKVILKPSLIVNAVKQ